VDVRAWLAGLGLESYAEAFADNDIDGATLAALTAEDLKEVGVASVGHRRKLLEAIAALTNGEAEAAPVPDDRAALSAEQRQVTVLFADLAGFTKLSDELGAEATHALLNRYFETVDAVVEGYGGSIDKHMGDNVMAVFGAPVAHSDDPERALRAALDIHPAMAELSKEFGRDLRTHIGIASGQVVASGTGSDAHREYTVTGNSVNLASRLQDKAEGGETLISQAVHRAVMDAVECVPMGKIEVKGFAEPVPVWRLQGLRSDVSGDRHGPFVGRRAERRQFDALIQECLETGSGQTILARGEAGIGKTRLVEEFAAKRSWRAARPASARPGWSRNSRHSPRPAASPTTRGWCSISASARVRTRSGPWCAACSVWPEAAPRRRARRRRTGRSRRVGWRRMRGCS